MRLFRRAARVVGGSLDGQRVECSTRLLYLRRGDASYEEYRRDGNTYVFSAVVMQRNPGHGASTTLYWKPVPTLVPWT